MAKRSLDAAKAAKEDEFYTHLSDISVVDSASVGKTPNAFSKELYSFDENYSHLNTIRSIVPVHTNLEYDNINIRRSNTRVRDKIGQKIDN